MNHLLQAKFEKQMLDVKIIKDRKLFNKDSEGIYIYQNTWWMYRVWVYQEAKIEAKDTKHAKQLEESFMCGYTECEYDFKFRRLLNENTI